MEGVAFFNEIAVVHEKHLKCTVCPDCTRCSLGGEVRE